jgi:hypothetical protein
MPIGREPESVWATQEQSWRRLMSAPGVRVRRFDLPRSVAHVGRGRRGPPAQAAMAHASSHLVQDFGFDATRQAYGHHPIPGGRPRQRRPGSAEGPQKGEFGARHPVSGFGIVGIAAEARTGHNVTRHDIALGWSDRAALSGKARGFLIQPQRLRNELVRSETHPCRGNPSWMTPSQPWFNQAYRRRHSRKMGRDHRRMR